ncbi:MAG: 4,5-DOPA dioxygenase extradiol [Hydrogenophilales bacterium]|nr:4,5-DOPA dioxygenase extradiol [Hydrogenophilales bacterium]
MTPTLPALFIGHGNPMHALQDNAITQAWHGAVAGLPRPRAILVISAHWLTRGTAVTAMAHPETLHDFEGFPRQLAEFDYPAPGDPALAQEIADLLGASSVALDLDWGLDHGAWSVLAHLYPRADIPVVQLSLDVTRRAAEHYALGRTLRPLRAAGVLVVGSGNVIHNLGLMDWRHPDSATDWARRFNDRLRDQLELADHNGLLELDSADAHLAVPTPEHYWPLLYIAALADAGETPAFFNDRIEYGSIGMLSFRIGAQP